MIPQGGFSGPGPGSIYNGPRPRLGLAHGFLYNLCSTISSCFYVFCCCWLIEDCLVGRRSYPRHHFGYDEPPPPPPPQVGPFFNPGPHGILGSLPGPPGPPQPGIFDYAGEPPPPSAPGTHGLL